MINTTSSLKRPSENALIASECTRMSNIINRYIKMSHGTLNESTNLRKLCAKSLEQFDQVNEAGPAETIVDMM
jgi:hypothetical protein